ncbi:MAG: hypothetical protein, partial [Olavius algarvensis Delta 4 endosymbiont]
GGPHQRSPYPLSTISPSEMSNQNPHRPVCSDFGIDRPPAFPV